MDQVIKLQPNHQPASDLPKYPSERQAERLFIQDSCFTERASKLLPPGSAFILESLALQILLVESEFVIRLLDCGLVCLFEILVQNDISILPDSLHPSFKTYRSDISV